MAYSDTDPVIADRDLSKKAPGTSSSSRYRVRTDLEIETETDGGSSVTLVDPRTGERHLLTADEFRLCQLADGARTLALIRQTFTAETGRDVTHGKLFTFFRRLRGLGLLEDSAADKPILPSASAKTVPSTIDEATSDKAASSEAGTTPAAGGGGEPAAPQAPAEAAPDAVAAPTADEPAAIRSEPSDKQVGAQTVAGKGAGTAALAARLGGGAGGRGRAAVAKLLAGAGRPAAARGAAASASEPTRISLLDPNAVLGLVAAVAWPLKYVFVPLLLAVPVAAAVAYGERADLVQDIRAFDVSVVGTVIVALVIVNFVSRLTQGTFIRGFGGEVRQFGIALTFGIPRFFVDRRAIPTRNRRGQLWAYAGPLLARLGLFCAGTLLWFAVRELAPGPAHLALVVGQIGLLAFLLSALPLLPSDGYRWLATYFGRPALYADVLAARPGRHLQETDEDDAGAIAASQAVNFYTVAAVLAVAVLVLAGQVYFDVATTGDVQWVTAATFLGVGIALAAWAVALRSEGRRRDDIEDLDPASALKLLTTGTRAAEIANDRPASVGAVAKVFWAVALSALVAVAFLPYRYHAAGAFEILPAQRIRVTVRTAGEIQQVLVREGEWVKANQPLAKLSADDQQREITITRAELDRAKAQLAQFGDKSKATTEKSDPGLDALNRSIADALGDDPDSAGAKKDAAGADYFQTQAERAARAEVERLTHKLAYERDQLADTTVRAPADGRVVTQNVHLLTGTYLRRGGELLSLADTRTLEAQIDVPEADIGLVKVGDEVHARPWSDENLDLTGKVTDIAPTAQMRPYGMVVRVRASIPSDEASLRPSITGYAKIDGGNVRVWEAFLGRIVRLVRIEMWSWIP